MRKYLAMLLAAVMLLTMMPLGAAAAETDTSERDELIALACEVFPEYTNKIKNKSIGANLLSRTSGQRELVATETRSVPDGETLIYSEYSDGVVLLTEYDFGKEVTYVDRQTGAGITTTTVNIKATCSGTSGYFQLTNVVYTLVSSSYDMINDTGSASTTGNCSITKAYSPVLNETASGNAKLVYSLQFRLSSAAGDFLTSQLKLEVGDDSAAVTHYEITGG